MVNPKSSSIEDGRPLESEWEPEATASRWATRLGRWRRATCHPVAVEVEQPRSLS